MGVWIETRGQHHTCCQPGVTPYVGVWIETPFNIVMTRAANVTPYVGVWIETAIKQWIKDKNASHPTWVCGLKLGCYQHSIGCVD